MNLPRKCGEMYIKFDDNNEPEYGFLVGFNSINKFIKLCDKEIDTIILPPIVESEKCAVESIDENKKQDKFMLEAEKDYLQDYITGRLKICDKCFKGIKKARIIVPFENSVMLDWGCFDSDAEIEFVLPKNLGLKQIKRRFDTYFDYENENWTLIADKNISGNLGWRGFSSDFYSIDEYNPEKLYSIVANFTVTHNLNKIGKAENKIYKEERKKQ